jgi:hypothetical protein
MIGFVIGMILGVFLGAEIWNKGFRDKTKVFVKSLNKPKTTQKLIK